METMFVWIVMFAGAAIALLAVFLVASEKELKKKRVEIDELLLKLGDAPAQNSPTIPGSTTPVVDNEEFEKLLAQNQELEKQLAAISNNSEPNPQIAEELELAQRNVEIAKSNAQWLQSTNDELKAEIAELKKSLQTHAAPATELAAQTHVVSERERALEEDVADLQQQLAESRAKIHELEGIEHKLANIDVIEANHRDEQRGLQTRIAELERQRAADADKLAEIDSLRQRLAESDRIQQTLREERGSFDQEIARLRARVSEAEEHGHRLSALQEPFDKLLAKQASLEEQQREYQEALARFSHLVTTANAGAQPEVTFNEFNAAAPVGETRLAPAESDAPDVDAMAVMPEHIVAAGQGAEKPKRTFGFFPAAIVLAFAGALAAGLWSLKASDSTAPATVTASALPARSQNPPPATPSPEPAAGQPAATPAAPVTNEIAAPIVKQKTEPAKPVQAVKTEKAVAGTYEVTHSSRVYAAPSELSQAMGDIEPGVKVNVVNSKNGWLEIHSKHGRPPGYIRKEAARLAAQN